MTTGGIINETWRMPAVSENLLAGLVGQTVELRGFAGRTLVAGLDDWTRIDLERGWLLGKFHGKVDPLRLKTEKRATFSSTSPEIGLLVWPDTTRGMEYAGQDIVMISLPDPVEAVEIVSASHRIEPLNPGRPAVDADIDFAVQLRFPEGRCLSISARQFPGTAAFSLLRRPVVATDYVASPVTLSTRPAVSSTAPTHSGLEPRK